MRKDTAAPHHAAGKRIRRASELVAAAAQIYVAAQRNTEHFAPASYGFELSIAETSLISKPNAPPPTLRTF